MSVRDILANIMILALTLVLVGCNRSETLTKLADIDPEGWNGSKPCRIVVANEDTVRLSDISFIFRYDESYDNSLDSLTVRITTPDTLWYQERIATPLSRKQTTNTGFYEDSVPYRQNVRLSSRGEYIFELSPAGGNATGIWGAGVMVTPVKD